MLISSCPMKKAEKGTYPNNIWKAMEAARSQGNPVTQAMIAEALGISQPNVSDLIHGRIYLTPRRAITMTKLLNCKPQDLSDEFKRVFSAKTTSAPNLPDHSLIKTISIFGNVSAANGIIQGLADPDGNRKLYLDVPEECFAVEVSGDSMEPRYWHGDKLLIHPTQTIIRGMDVLIRLPDGEGMIKTFKHEKAGVITYTQYFPKQTDKTIKRADIEGMQAVLCRWG